ncbi:aspartate aminotransferase family protein [Paenisporosarcina sp. OV554]|uniref:aspartate aminotransferase family protein n=1 Tax=Paenisporosarcina sp. OV554 TaxID=2135694 RepID=UPI000D391E66|nr:aspartate aminotransferase family protein [Paenisporosarcina sp. OV554]PUB10124.1 acetylornithine aminotransferase [Paenisporosarcina sp. OV554]
MSNHLTLSVEQSPVMNTYTRFPVTMVKGKGSFIWDEKEDKYLDFTSGIATCNLGHVPGYVHDKVQEQLSLLWHCSNLYHIPSQEKLAKLLIYNSFGDQVFFCNSGTEANEALIKLARKHAEMRGKDSRKIITFKHSFHGRTLAALSATGQEKLQQGFAPLVEGFQHLEFNSFEDLKVLETIEACGVLLELVQGEGGVIPANKEWVLKLAEICKQNDLLLMIDEIQTGMGRTGSLFAYQQYGIIPDIVSLAKGLGSGFPIGALIASNEVAQAFNPGSHGSTFGGNPLATSAGLATVQYIVENQIAQDAQKLGSYLVEKLEELQKDYPQIKEVRGLGLLVGVVFEGSALDVVKKLLAEKVLTLTAGEHVLRILPPLNASKDEVDLFVKTLENVLSGE